VDDYLVQCEYDRMTSEVAYKGSLNVRFRGRETHRRSAIYAIGHNQILNSFIEEAVREARDGKVTKN
jgi:predicted HicB family RNase H-like nuclease